MTKYLYALLLLLTAPVIASETLAPEQVAGAVTINTATAKLLFDKGFIFVDVRKQEDYERSHIPGARHLSVNSEYFTVENLRAIVKKRDTVVFYCNGIHCMGSSKASQKAAEWGWQKILYYREGIQGWEKAGYAVNQS